MYEFAGSKSAKLVVQKIREIVTRSALVYFPIVIGHDDLKLARSE